MSTRCNIHFNHGRSVHANIYRHSDGYPGVVTNGEPVEGGLLPDLLEFFRTLKAEVPDARFGQAEYLAAKFLVWQANVYAKYGRIYKPAKGPVDEEGYGPEHRLQFLSVSPCIRDHGDIEFIYEVDCDKFDDEGFPVVRWKEVRWEGPNWDKRVRTKFKTVRLGRDKAKAA